MVAPFVNIAGIYTYYDLVQRCQDWLFGRADLAVQVPTFIQLFEAKANRKLFCRQMEQRAFANVDMTLAEPEFIDLPIGFQSMRRVRVVDPPGPVQKPRLKFATGAQMDDLRARFQTAGPPIWFSIFGVEMELNPRPNSGYRLEMVYRSYIQPLGPDPTADGIGDIETPHPQPLIIPPPQYTPPGLQPFPVNWLLQTAPDAYLYGTLMEAAPYLHDDERIAVWAAGVQGAITELNALSDEATYNAGPLTMRRKGSSYS